jgi:hypothetical protein
MPKTVRKCLDPREVDPSPVYQELESVARTCDGIDDWVTVKVEIMQRLNPYYRRFFSTRDPKTKEQSMNEFEVEIARRYAELTGIELILRTREQRRAIYGKI